MLTYSETLVGFSEVPDEISLCINICGCPIKCPDCHSKHLWKQSHKILNCKELSSLISTNKGITCVSFMGGDADIESVISLASWVRNHTKLKVCWYSGRKSLSEISLPYKYFDYIKIGPYNKELGGLDSPTTNQRFFKVKVVRENNIDFTVLDDITFKFRNNETSNKYTIIKSKL
jgi:anaerobic ribonucleoside-triphosphate reductase activating protein